MDSNDNGELSQELNEKLSKALGRVYRTYKQAVFYRECREYEEWRLREIERNYRDLSKNPVVKIIKFLKGIKDPLAERPKPPKEINDGIE